MRCFVIAEASATHDGSLAKAQDLVRLAASIGADACKFQWVSSAERLCDRRRAPTYLNAYRLLEFPHDWFADLASRCEDHGLEFMCTAYLPEDIAVIAPYVKRFKVASFEVAAGDIGHALAEYAKPVLYSTGMNAVNFPIGDGYKTIRRLHCVSAYPTPNGQMNLAVLRDPTYAGLSDHSRHPWTGALAAAAGAEIIEFHIRLDTTDPANADYAAARNPAEAAEYVGNIRLAEAMLGDGIKRIQECERPYLRYRVVS